MIATVLSLLIPGILCIGGFAYLNFVVQPRLFPGDALGDRAALIAAAKAKASNKRAHILLGVAETALFLVGAILVTAAGSVVGTTLGYGGG